MPDQWFCGMQLSPARWSLSGLKGCGDCIVDEAEVTFRLLWLDISILKERVRKVCRYRGCLSDGIQFHHDDRSAPSFIVVAEDSDGFLDVLRKFGYPVCVD